MTSSAIADGSARAVPAQLGPGVESERAHVGVAEDRDAEPACGEDHGPACEVERGAAADGLDTGGVRRRDRVEECLAAVVEAVVVRHREHVDSGDARSSVEQGGPAAERVLLAEHGCASAGDHAFEIDRRDVRSAQDARDRCPGIGLAFPRDRLAHSFAGSDVPGGSEHHRADQQHAGPDAAVAGHDLHRYASGRRDRGCEDEASEGAAHALCDAVSADDERDAFVGSGPASDGQPRPGREPRRQRAVDARWQARTGGRTHGGVSCSNGGAAGREHRRQRAARERHDARDPEPRLPAPVTECS